MHVEKTSADSTTRYAKCLPTLCKMEVKFLQDSVVPCKLCGQEIDRYHLGLHMYRVHGHRRAKKTQITGPSKTIQSTDAITAEAYNKHTATPMKLPLTADGMLQRTDLAQTEEEKTTIQQTAHPTHAASPAVEEMKATPSEEKTIALVTTEITPPHDPTGLPAGITACEAELSTTSKNVTITPPRVNKLIRSIQTLPKINLTSSA